MTENDAKQSQERADYLCACNHTAEEHSLPSGTCEMIGCDCEHFCPNVTRSPAGEAAQPQHWPAIALYHALGQLAHWVREHWDLCHDSDIPDAVIAAEHVLRNAKAAALSPAQAVAENKRS